MIAPEDALDDQGGLMIRPPYTAEPHECQLPSLDSGVGGGSLPFTRRTNAHRTALEYQKLLAYRAVCGHWWRPTQHSSDFEPYWTWKRVGRFRLRRWRKKGLIPS